MAPKKKPSSSGSPMRIGNCKVSVKANKFTSEYDGEGLHISFSKNVKVRISVREQMDEKFNNELFTPKSEGNVDEGRKYTLESGYMFLLVNPKDTDSCSKNYLEEVLDLYTRELPTMNYAANTGKESMFLKRCVSNGKYHTLILKYNSTKGSGEIIAAITYQIVPSDTQYAEIPLAAVCSTHQHKGFGHALYLELRRRFQNIGVRTILCWGDKESEGFWLKQGFTSIAEVEKRGRVRRLPIKADIRRALCYPGGSTLMVSHLNSDTSSVEHYDVGHRFVREDSHGLNSLDPVIFRRESFQTEGSVGGGIPREGNELAGSSLDLMHGSGDRAALEGGESDKIASEAELVKIGADADAEHCSCATRVAKRRSWEASVSSLKSKKVKGSHQIDCHLDSNWNLVSENDRNGFCFDDCSLDARKKTLVEATQGDPLTSGNMDNSKELQSKGDCFRIMLMNIADDTKKIHLTKVQ